VFQKFNPLLHGGAAAEQAAEGGATGEAAQRGKVQILTLEFVRKYIAYAKATALSQGGPKLTDEAREEIAIVYTGACRGRVVAVHVVVWSGG